MRCKKRLNKYVVEDYFTWQGRDATKESLLTDEADVVREQNSHLCQCQRKDGSWVKNYDFVKNFKICYVKMEEILYSNENLLFKLDEENDIFIKKDNFISEISGKI